MTNHFPFPSEKRHLMSSLHTDALKMKKDLLEKQQDLKRLQDAITRLREIYLCRTCADVTKKLFHDMPIKPKRQNTVIGTTTLHRQSSSIRGIPEYQLSEQYIVPAYPQS